MAGADEAGSDSQPAQGPAPAHAGFDLPFLSLARAALHGISNQTLLFVIVVAILVIGLDVVGSTTAISDLRFLITVGVILLLAIIALFGVLFGSERGSSYQTTSSANAATLGPMAAAPKPRQIPSAAATPPIPSQSTGEQLSGPLRDREQLERLKAIHRTNLDHLEQQRALYGELAVPVRLRNEIQLEEKALNDILEQLGER